MQIRRSQGRGLFLTYVCCSYLAILLAAPVLTASDSASLGAAARRALQTFEQADRNHDGVVSRFESRAVRGLSERGEFKAADTNRDGFIDRIEYAKAIGAPGAR